METNQVYALDMFAHLFIDHTRRPTFTAMTLIGCRLLFLCWFCLLAPWLPWAEAGENPEIKDIIVTTSDTDLLLFATVKNGFTQEMVADLKQGVPVVFTFHMELIKTDGRWLNTSLMETSISHTLTFDPASNLYQVTLGDQGNKVLTTKDLEQAKVFVSELNGVKVIDLDKLVPDAPYAIHFKVTLKKGQLPLGLHRVLPFSSLWNFETDWRTIEFRY